MSVTWQHNSSFALADNKILLEHLVLISVMVTGQGGFDLDMEYPRSTAIPAYFLTNKSNIQYATEGGWTSINTVTIVLYHRIRPLAAPQLGIYHFNSIFAVPEILSGLQSDLLQWTSKLACQNGQWTEEIRTMTSKHLKVLHSLPRVSSQQWHSSLVTTRRPNGTKNASILYWHKQNM